MTITTTMTLLSDGTLAVPGSPGYVPPYQPMTPIIMALHDDVGPHTGDLGPGGVTDDTRPTLTGTAEPGSRVDVLDNGVKLGSVVTGADWQWSFTPTDPLAQGSHDFTAQSWSSTATAADSLSSVYDFPTQIGGEPAQVLPPVITDVYDPGSPLHPRTPDEGGTTATKVAVQGTAEPNTRVEVFDGAQSLGVALTDPNWHWSLNLPDLGSGVHRFTAQSTFLLDGHGATSSPVAYQVTLGTSDVSVHAPTILQLTDNVGDVQGPIDMAHTGVTDDTTPTLAGLSQPGTTVEIHASSTPTGEPSLLGSTTVDADGHWSYTTPTLTPWTHYFTALAVTPDGLASAVDEQPPVGCQITPASMAIDTLTNGALTLQVIDDVGPVQGPLTYLSLAFGVTNFYTDDAQPTYTGSGVPGSVIVANFNTLVESTSVDSEGHWSLTPSEPLTVGTWYPLDVTDQSATDSQTVYGAIHSWPFKPSLLIWPDAPSRFTLTAITDHFGTVQGDIPLQGGQTDDPMPVLHFNTTYDSNQVVTVLGNWVDTNGLSHQFYWITKEFDSVNYTYENFVPETPIDIPAGTLITLAVESHAHLSGSMNYSDLHSSFIFGPDLAAPSTALDTLLTNASLPAQASPAAPTAVAADVATPTVHTAAHVWQTAAVHDLAY